HEAGARGHRRGARPLRGEPSIELAPEVGGRLDRLDVVQRGYAAAQRGIVAPAPGALNQMALETPQLPRGGDEAVTELGVAVEEFPADHNGGLVPPGPRGVPGPG